MQTRFTEVGWLMNKKPLNGVFWICQLKGCHQSFILLLELIYELIIEEKKITPVGAPGNHYGQLSTGARVIREITHSEKALGAVMNLSSFIAIKGQEETKVLIEIIKVCVDKYKEKILRLNQDNQRLEANPQFIVLVELRAAYQTNQRKITEEEKRKRMMEEILSYIS